MMRTASNTPPAEPAAANDEDDGNGEREDAQVTAMRIIELEER
jgi:hypothetical protein